MNNIDLNTITIAEAKKLGVEGMDLFTVIRNPINSSTLKKNEEFAADLNAKTEKKKPARKATKSVKKKITLGSKLNWQSGDKITKLFKTVSDLLGAPFSDWKSSDDYNDSINVAMREVFSADELAGHTDEHLIERGNHQIYLANRAIEIITEDGDEAADKLNGNDIGSFWHNNFHVVNAAGKANLISKEEHNTFLNYLESVRFA